MLNPGLQYYINQPIEPNSVLGAAAFVLASLEVERLNDNPYSPLSTPAVTRYN